jgi:hypothetical protein
MEFPPEQFWNDATETMVFPAIVDNKRVRCRISLEALADRFGTYNNDPKEIFKPYRSQIERIAERKITAGQLESDGSILIRTHDVP